MTSASKKQNFKNLERMKLEINKRIENHLLDIMRTLDENSISNDDEDDFGQ